MGWLKPRPKREYRPERTWAPVITLERRTLAHRLEAGKLAMSEALRLAMEVAHALRQLHEKGQAHGALTPAAIELTASGIELIPGGIPRGVPTPYSAPEVLKGEPADWRSDIFSFGAIVHELITGRWAFEGVTPEMLAVAIQDAATPQTGDPTVDSLLRQCLAKDPATRCQRIQKILTELRLASVTSRRNEGPERRAQFEAAVRSEIQAALESHTTTQLHALEQTIRAQAAALEAIRNALTQTDDLVERVVEALDFLQSTVMERSTFLPGRVSAQSGRVVRPISG